MDEQAKRKVPGEFRVVRYDVRDFVGDYRAMEYGDPLDARMTQLRDEFGLESVVAGYGTEFEAILALKRWVRCRWNHGWSRSFRTVKDGLDILREAAKGEQFCCGHYTRVFVDCATALGWPARQVGIAIANCEFPRDHNVGNVGHSIAEIWCNEHGKWVVMDPDVNCHYERDGVPLNAMEVRDAWLSGAAD
ncbi:MAG: transglutaminase domain-containing protein, partial [Armatimonadota bacterium]